MSMANVRVAFQGGGAKLASMLPIADAFSSANQKDIHISAVSGTSAGAICASLVAVNADFESVRRHLVDKGPEYLKALIPPRVSALSKLINESGKVRWYQALKNFELLKDITLRGKPVLHEEALRSMVSDLLSFGANGAKPNFEKLSSKLYITASNIVESTGKTHNSGDIVEAVVDSCSLPVILRSFDTLSETHYVDGGLCENLPVECLIGSHNEPIFAVYPRSSVERLRIKNLIAYLSALLSASIGHSVKRSVSLVAEPFRFEAEAEFDFLDFDAAIETLGNEAWYRQSRDAARFQIDEFVKQYGEAHSPSQARVVDVMSLSDYQSALSAVAEENDAGMRCCASKFIVRVHSSLLGQKELREHKRRSDTITRSLRFEVKDKIPDHHLSHVKLRDEKIMTTIWSAKNITTGGEIPIKALPLEEKIIEGQEVRECYVKFVNPKVHISTGDIIELQSIYHSIPGSDMSEMNLENSDSIVYTNVRSETVPEIDIVVIYPRRLGNYKLQFDSEGSTPGLTRPIAMPVDEELKALIGHENRVTGLRFSDVPNAASMRVLAVRFG